MVALAEPPGLKTLPASEQGAYGRQQRQSEGRKIRLKQALFVNDLTIEALTEMRGSLSFADPESARDNALSLASAVKSWDTAQERIRILKGESLPGNKKPLPEVPKVKPKKLNKPPPSLAPTVPEAPQEPKA